ncbi:MAG: T9SS type A sorting domain-containing protein [Flavobacteriales bacterium]|nr:T9SS type A sorting domain-containing protein [Flavobacteriales bacterium]
MMKSFTKLLFVFFVGLAGTFNATAQEHSVAMKWNEVQLDCIRKDRPRPTVQARHLCHASIVMWDAWAAYDDCAQTMLLGNTWSGFSVPFEGIPHPDDVEAAREKAISYAMFRFLWQRYLSMPTGVPNNVGQVAFVTNSINSLMMELGYDPSITSTDYTDGDPAKLGNYIAQQMQLYAVQDGANQNGGGAGFANQYYVPYNTEPLNPNFPGTPTIDPNRWQPLCLLVACQQGTSIEQGNCIPEPMACNAPALSPEFGHVNPFAMTLADQIIIQRDGHDWPCYHDQGAPPYLDPLSYDGLESFFKWGYVMDIIWHSLHDPTDGVWVDISPNSVGNILEYPASNDFAAYQQFYGLYDGSDASTGFNLNPATGLPYAEQWVPRGDYTRVLSEFWADGPNSETPPGHWFTLLNEKVTLHPDFEKRWMGEGDELNDLGWDVRAYLTLGGSVMDAAIACWGAKGAYDYGRPIFAIRYMAERGQCTDPLQPNYHPEGLPLIPDYIEVVEIGDPLAGLNNENVGKIKIYSWAGPPAATGLAGVHWILGEEWWTYQSSTFVTPPFPGYMSGHSTYSRTAAEVLTAITGDEYFPGGMGEYTSNALTGLIAETGPTMNIKLQWARYIDASDQCSLSRIFGGLHPPQDDIPGRHIGMVLGPEAVAKANSMIEAQVPHAADFITSTNVVNDDLTGQTVTLTVTFTKPMNTSIVPALEYINDDPTSTLSFANAMWMNNTSYMVTYNVADVNETLSNVVWKVSGAVGANTITMVPALSHVLVIDTENPMVETTVSEIGSLFNDTDAAAVSQDITLTFNEAMDTSVKPQFTFPVEDPSNSIVYNQANSSWTNNTTFVASFDVYDVNEEISSIDVLVITGLDAVGNTQVPMNAPNSLTVDTKNPTVTMAMSSDDLISDSDDGFSFSATFMFDEEMNTSVDPMISFGSDVASSFTNMTGEWVDGTTFEATYTVADANVEISGLAISSVSGWDANGNEQVAYAGSADISIDTENPTANSASVSVSLISDATVVNNDFTVTIQFSEPMSGVIPSISFPEGELTNVEYDGGAWLDSDSFEASFTLTDGGEEIDGIDIAIVDAEDAAGNVQTMALMLEDAFSIDTRNPEIVVVTANEYNITSGTEEFSLVIVFDEAMNESDNPSLSFPVEDPSATLNASGSDWLTAATFEANYTVEGEVLQLLNIDVNVASATDEAGNSVEGVTLVDFFDINAVVSVSELTSGSLSMYPNPVSSGNQVILSWADMPSKFSLRIFNTMGKEVEVLSNVNNQGNIITIDTAGLASGMYFVSLTTETGQNNLQFQVID